MCVCENQLNFRIALNVCVRCWRVCMCLSRTADCIVRSVLSADSIVVTVVAVEFFLGHNVQEHKYIRTYVCIVCHMTFWHRVIQRELAYLCAFVCIQTFHPHIGTHTHTFGIDMRGMVFVYAVSLCRPIVAYSNMYISTC